MGSRTKRTEANVNVELDEPLTSDSCAKLTIELVKYILYQKEQIPFTCEMLAQLHSKVTPVDRNTLPIGSLLKSLKRISDELSTELLNRSCKIREIVIIVGGTIVSPKLRVRLVLPTNILDSHSHLECEHSSRKPLLKLMRSMMECSEFQQAMALPLTPTNTFVLLQKSDYNSTSEFFLPKPQYVPPTQVLTCINIRLHNNKQTRSKCNCTKIVPVYRELPSSSDNGRSQVQFSDHSDQSKEDCYGWYQSKEVLKGFKYVR